MIRKSLFLSLLFLLLATAAFAQTPPYTKTIIVGDTLNPITNGNDLLAAIATPGTPGVNDRWLVFVEPGTYDLGGSTLVMRDFVDVVGSGRNSTHVTSAAAVTVQAPAGIDAELRELTVENDPSPFALGPGTGILIETEEFKLTVVNVEVRNVTDGIGIDINAPGRPRLSAVFPRIEAFNNATGLRVQGDGVIINEMFVFILAFTGNNTGIRIEGTGESIVEQVSGFVAGASLLNTGLHIVDSSPRVTNNQWVVDDLGIGSRSIGLFVTNPGGVVTQPLVRESQFVAQNAPSLGAGAWVNGSASLQLQHSLLRAVGGTTYGFLLQNTATAELDQNVIQGNTGSIRTAGATFVEVGATKLDGARFVGGGSVCVQSYDGFYAPIAFGAC